MYLVWVFGYSMKHFQVGMGYRQYDFENQEGDFGLFIVKEVNW